MSADLIPSRLAILLTLAACLGQYLLRQRWDQSMRTWLSAGVIQLTGGLALLHFIANEQWVCMVQAGQGNCFVSGLGSIISALLLSGLALSLVRRQVRLGAAAAELNHVRLLFFVAALIGVAVGENLLIVIPALIGLYASLDYWLRHRGLRWGFLVVRDDYKDDVGPS
jgi:hypothetical protein